MTMREILIVLCAIGVVFWAWHVEAGEDDPENWYQEPPTDHETFDDDGGYSQEDIHIGRYKFIMRRDRMGREQQCTEYTTGSTTWRECH